MRVTGFHDVPQKNTRCDKFFVTHIYREKKLHVLQHMLAQRFVHQHVLTGEVDKGSRNQLVNEILCPSWRAKLTLEVNY